MKTITGLNIEFYLNDQLIKDTVTPETSALTFIRERLGLTGSKEVCAEGDCGACTIAVGRFDQNKQYFSYLAINSCILPAVKLHGAHVITIEGLAKNNQLHLIQQAMLENHAVQCGYCTAGMIMALFCLFANNQQPNEKEILAALEGNLCRCTGYKFIQKSAFSITNSLKNKEIISTCFFPETAKAIHEAIQKSKPKAISATIISAKPTDSCESYLIPTTLNELFIHMEKRQGDFKILNGGTDLMVPANLHNIWPRCFIDISMLNELHGINADQNQMTFGANVTFSEILANDLVKQKLPILGHAISQMSSTQIRNVATLAGNIANASPIADAACMLLALDAELVLLSRHGERRIKLAGFYQGYKVIDLDSTKEIIAKIIVPFESGFCHFEKTSRRRALSIATVNSAIKLHRDNNNTITTCHIAFGGIAKFPTRSKNTQEYLIGKKLNSETISLAATIAGAEFEPISDVRGSADYRIILIKNHIIKHLELCK